MIDIQQRNDDRNAVLLRMFYAANGDSQTPFQSEEIRTDLGWDAERFTLVCTWASANGWIKPYAFGGTYIMTAEAVGRVEAALSKPAPLPTESDNDYRPGNYV